jgi:putative ATP-dependent endonuclease of OLD family
MQLRHLRVERFRGIALLEWNVRAPLACLIGPGDSCKSTVLDAVELALSPRWNVQLDDSDFFGGSPSKPLVIDATVGDLPRAFESDSKFGLHLRGFSAAGVIHDEPETGDEHVLTIRFTTDASLEPNWFVYTERDPDGTSITAREREKLGVLRLGALVDWHLTWTKGSLLSRLTGTVDEHADILAEASRTAREKVVPSQLQKLADAARQVCALGHAFGLARHQDYQAHVDPRSILLGAGSLSLHEGNVPFRRAGLGTRRLLALAVQRHIEKGGGVTLIDELEHGLEPYRIRRLIGVLRGVVPPAPPSPPPQPSPTSNDKAATPAPAPVGSTILTSHSPVVVTELSAQHLNVVRRAASGTVTITQVPDSLQHIVRWCPEALLSRRIIVCEGDTEIGFCRGLDKAGALAGRPFALTAVAFADGQGCTRVGARAIGLRELGYEVSVFADSDKPLDKTTDELERAAVSVFVWPGTVATEERIMADVPWNVLVQLVLLAEEWHGPVIREHVATALQRSPKDLAGHPNDWISLGEPTVRTAVGKAAKSSSWFKRTDRGEVLGETVSTCLSAVASTGLAQTVEALRQWVYRDL